MNKRMGVAHLLQNMSIEEFFFSFDTDSDSDKPRRGALTKLVNIDC